MLKFIDASFNALFFFLQHTQGWRGGGGGVIMDHWNHKKVNHFIIMLKFIDASFNALFFFQHTQKMRWGEAFVCVCVGGGVVN